MCCVAGMASWGHAMPSWRHGARPCRPMPCHAMPSWAARGRRPHAGGQLTRSHESIMRRCALTPQSACRRRRPAAFQASRQRLVATCCLAAAKAQGAPCFPARSVRRPLCEHDARSHPPSPIGSRSGSPAHPSGCRLAHSGGDTVGSENAAGSAAPATPAIPPPAELQGGATGNPPQQQSRDSIASRALLDDIDDFAEMEYEDTGHSNFMSPTLCALLEDHGPLSTMSSKTYFSELLRLQMELVQLQDYVSETGQKVVVLFEGRDAAGKGGAIKRIVHRLNPRICRVVALPAPSPREESQWFFQRYVPHLPAAGEIVLFDRSW